MGKRRFQIILVIAACHLPLAAAAQPRPKKSSAPAEATLYDYTRAPSFPDLLDTYSAPFVPQAKLANSSLLDELISDGVLNLSFQDAIALALENNLDIAVARYNLPIAQTDLLRAKAGGATRGVAGAYQSNVLFQGALGGGVSSRTSSAGGGGAGVVLGGGVPAIAPASCCDPYVNVAYGWGHTVSPLNYTILSGVPVDTAQSAYVATSFSQGFLTGTGVSVNVYGYRDSSNETTDLFNPYLASSMTVGITQHLLRGFGYRTNAVFVRQARHDLKYSKSVFRQKVAQTVTNVMTLYYSLLADREHIRVAKETLGYAQRLLSEIHSEVKMGAARRLTGTGAKSLHATTRA